MEEELCALLILLEALEFGAEGVLLPLFPVEGGEVQSSLCDFAANIQASGLEEAQSLEGSIVAFKNCPPFLCLPPSDCPEVAPHSLLHHLPPHHRGVKKIFQIHPLQVSSQEGESHLGVLEMADVHSPEPLTHGHRLLPDQGHGHHVVV